MQKIPIDENRYILFNEATNTASVITVQELEERIENIRYNIQEVEKMIGNLEDKILTTDDPKLQEAVDQYNHSLGIERYKQELVSLQQELSELCTL